MSIRVGVIGLNYGARVHIASYKDNPAYDVAAVCARTPEKAQAVARDYDIPRWYTDAKQLIMSEVDLVSIASPPRTHSGFAAAALAAGKHAVVEIAFVASTLEARVLLDMAMEMKRVGAPAFVFRYTPTLRMVSDLLAQGRIGAPRLMRFELFNDFLLRPDRVPRWMWDGDNGGGIMAGYVSHAFDLARRWFGPAREVDATLATFSQVDMPDGAVPLGDDTGVVTFHFDNDVMAVFSHSAVTAYPRTSIELHGTEGSLLIEGFGDEAAFLPQGEREAQVLFPPEQYLEETRGHSGLLGGFDVFLDRLAAAINEGQSPPDLPTLVDGLEVTRMVDAAKMASRQKRRVKVSDIRSSIFAQETQPHVPTYPRPDV
jgi:predicted dehydrogenase